ncbi:MAG: DUF1080 domain-containing protein [Acidobacteriota bacterium]
MRSAIRCLLPALAIVCGTTGAVAQGRTPRVPEVTAAAAAPNTLTAAEKAAGWKLLFDGKTTNGWRGFKREGMPDQGWTVEDGAIKHLAGKEGVAGGGDIITVGDYGSFDLSLDWKITAGGNSGLKYLISEDLVKTGHSGVSFEMQILDDERHPDAKAGKGGNRTAGSLYDLVAPSAHTAHPAGEWNTARLVIQGRHVEHWLNGQRVVQFELGSPELKALIAESKYKAIAGFGENTRGHILLQDHGDEAWFRNIKIRELPVPAATK